LKLSNRLRRFSGGEGNENRNQTNPNPMNQTPAGEPLVCDPVHTYTPHGSFQAKSRHSNRAGRLVRKVSGFVRALFAPCGVAMLASQACAQFVHPGGLSTREDLDRMATKAANNEQPWKVGYDRMASNGYAQPGHTPAPQATVYASGSQPDKLHPSGKRCDRIRVRVDGVTTVDEADVTPAYPGVVWRASGRVGLQNAHAAGVSTVEYRSIAFVPIDP
jgi:hypothetical protein